MVKAFLKKYQEELLSEKIDLKEQIDMLQTKITEETKFVEVLEESNKSYFSEFTPRTLNEKNRTKAIELRSVIEKLEYSKSELLEKIDFLDNRLSEVNNLISYISNDGVIISSSQVEDNNDNLKNNNINNKLKIDNPDDLNIIDDLNRIKEYIFLDQHRASLEVDLMISKLKNN